MIGYKYTLITSIFFLHELTYLFLYGVDIFGSSKKTQFFKEGDFDLDLFERGGRASLKCALISYFCALFQVFDAFVVVSI